ncbi:MAG: SGNH/GDSL hydrolase family protein [Kiritimatiellaeota bacterium]|nr:SGNH/GDSL hydrolase family protein [Kiritimatiellota bacterium]
MSMIRDGDLILFQGDSITDAGRRTAADGLGGGYVAIIRGWLAAGRPDLRVRIVNRGVGGDRTAELLARWEEDCLALRPDVLSLMIGVNDVWRKAGEWNGQTHIPLDRYRRNLGELLDRAAAAGVRQFVLISPTTIEPENGGELNVLLGAYDAAVREEAARRGAVYVPAREKLMASRVRLPEVDWTHEGCHPTVAGHAILAQAWLEAAGLTS